MIFALANVGTFAAEGVVLSKDKIADKIKGGWAGKIIGCTYGGPTEFKYDGRTIPDSVKIEWNENKPIVEREFGGLYDDVYLDVTFVDVLEKKGFGAKRSEFLRAVGESSYPLWCANRAARFAWLDGFQKDGATSWRVNTTSNDIDFQIEADFAGLMCPSLPNEAAKFAETVGMAINSGDGYYCGLYVATMYSLAFVSGDVEWIVREALKALPKESTTRAIMEDILSWHKEDPKDWRYAWKKHFDKYVKTHDPNQGGRGIYAPSNCAYIIIGLLYGGGDFERTMDISTRCGFDSDCNPSSACGILGTVIGYANIPKKYSLPLEKSENLLFVGTDYSPKKLYEISAGHAAKVLESCGFKFSGDGFVSVPYKEPLPAKFEPPMRPVSELAVKTRLPVDLPLANGKSFSAGFEGCGVSFHPRGKFNENFRKVAGNSGLAGELEIYIDGKLVRTARLFFDFHRRERDFFFVGRDLPPGKHTFEVRVSKVPEAAALPDLSAELAVYGEIN